MAQRSKGEGSVHRSPDGAGWVAMIELPAGPDGKRVRRKRRAKTKTEALAMLRHLQAQMAQSGGLSDPNRLVSNAIDDFLAVRSSEGLSAKTLEGDRWRAELIRRALGHRRVSALTVGECDAFLRSAAAGELSPRGGPGTGQIATPQLRRLRAMFIRVLRNDVRLGTLHRNVAELSALPASASTTRPRHAISHAELEALRRTATGPIAVLIEMSGRYALRPAEARAVQWRDIDFDARTLHAGPRLNRLGERIGPKTKAADRILNIDGQTISFLREWQTAQAQQRSHAGPLWAETDLVATTAFGTALNHRNIHRSLAQLSRRTALSPAVSHYELRHTAISLQAQAGYSAWQIADWAGTSERMISDVYRHKLMEASPLGPVPTSATSQKAG